MMLGPSRVLGSALTWILIWTGMDIKQAAAAKLLQSCPTLCCPLERGSPGWDAEAAGPWAGEPAELGQKALMHGSVHVWKLPIGHSASCAGVRATCPVGAAQTLSQTG